MFINQTVIYTLRNIKLCVRDNDGLVDRTRNDNGMPLPFSLTLKTEIATYLK